MKLTIQHNSLIEGAFPIKELMNISSSISVKVDITDEPFINNILIEVESKDDSLKIAYQIGKLVGIILAKRIK